MSVYRAARAHVQVMLLVTAMGALFVIAVDALMGHSTWAFAIVIVVLIALNTRIWRYDCPKCGSNLFMRGVLPLPWPNATCSECGTDLTAG